MVCGKCNFASSLISLYILVYKFDLQRVIIVCHNLCKMQWNVGDKVEGR